MPRITIQRRVEAPLAQVFSVLADSETFAAALPHVVGHEFLTEQHQGVGTRFRETRLMNGKEEVTDLEVTEFVENEHVRVVTDSHGTIWDTVMSTSARGEHTDLELVMDARGHKLLTKLLNPLIMGMVRKAVATDVDLIKAYCEDGSR